MRHHIPHLVKTMGEDLPPLGTKKNPFIWPASDFFSAESVSVSTSGPGRMPSIRQWALFCFSIAFPVIGTVTALVLTAIWGVARASD